MATLLSFTLSFNIFVSPKLTNSTLTLLRAALNRRSGGPDWAMQESFASVNYSRCHQFLDDAANSRGSSSSETLDGNSENISTVSSLGLDNTAFPLSVEKLNGKNFLEWAQSIKLVIEGKWRLGYLTGERKKPATTDIAALQKLKAENSMVTAWLINSMKPSIGKIYLFLPMAKDVWDAVRETYSDAESYSQIFEIKTRLWQLRQGERKVTKYFMEMTTLW
ncbi:uncharacterized protein LOC131145973 [Malania oleifera]|uniref:uncharacterized protein LOC131145973 n=1 Tax=Malania oleifera TaxID=397392 RepID=UPI0025AE6D69|nr:uncharacterized protein LOC131145973 [Malania oleifera]